MVLPELTKTRSVSIMRRQLRDVAAQRETGDVTTLADSSVMDLIKEKISSGTADEE
jgi:acetyl-CoA synthetase